VDILFAFKNVLNNQTICHDDNVYPTANKKNAKVYMLVNAISGEVSRLG
jgi:hypothetical protein